MHKINIMQIRKDQLIENLLSLTAQSTKKLIQFKSLSIDDLNFKKDSGSWSILECVEHLNLYGDYYLPEIEKQILKGRKSNRTQIFKSGFIGNYFANLMQVKAGKLKKMKSPKDKIPANSKLTATTLDRFLKQQELLQSLLHQALHTDLNKTKTAISISTLIKLRLGDTFRFLIYHIDRHIQQAERNVTKEII